MKKLWFKARPYGWGWYPSSWEGIVVIGLWGLLVYLLFLFVNPEVHPVVWAVGLFGGIGVLIFITWKTGEKPSWRWGGKSVSAATVLVRIAGIVAIVAGIAGLIAWFI